MKSQPTLSEAEWTLIVNLLKQERDQLPTEIHHTYSREYRQELLERRQMIEDLLMRLQGVAVE